MADGDITIVRICEVIDIEDKTDSNRIKVRLLPEDGNKPVEDLPYVIPFIPQMIHIKPKLHEAVLILNTLANNGKSQRYYIGPVISQINHMYNEPMYDALNQYNTSVGKKDPAPTMDKNKTLGAVPKDDEIAILGRKNSDIILADNDLRIRCGAKKVDDLEKGTFSFNATDSAYLKLKYYKDGLEGVDKCNSTATIVADKINLIGNKSKEHSYQDEFINDEQMKKLIDTAHKLPYGDTLCEFLNLFRQAFLVHTHPFPMLPPCQEQAYYEKVKNYNLDTILSDSVRIN